MSVSIDVSVMAHPSRARQAERIVSALSKFPARVVFDPDPTGPRSTIRTAREAWRPWLPEATHHLVLQDDVLLHPDFEDQVTAAVSAQPHAILSFFNEWGSYTSHVLRVAAFGGFSWVEQPDVYLGTQAALMPTERAAKFAAELEHESLETPDDHAIRAYAHEHQIPHFVSNPNLVEHEFEDSLVGNDAQGARRATIAVLDATPPPGWWKKPPLVLKAVPAFHWAVLRATTYACVDEASEIWDDIGPADLWGDLRPAVSRLVSEAVDLAAGAEAGAELRSAGLDIAGILCDQIAVGKAVAGPVSDEGFSRTCARRAVESLVPGCFRKIEIESGLNLDRAAWSKAMRNLACAVDRDYAAKLDTGALRKQFLHNSAS